MPSLSVSTTITSSGGLTGEEPPPPQAVNRPLSSAAMIVLEKGVLENSLLESKRGKSLSTLALIGLSIISSY